MFQPIKRLLNPVSWLITHKLLYDLLFLVLLFFMGLILAETLLPGILTAHVSFSKVIFILGVVLAAIYATASLARINLENSKIHKKTTFFLLFFLIIIVFANLWKAGILINLIMLGGSMAAGFYLYKVMIEE